MQVVSFALRCAISQSDSSRTKCIGSTVQKINIPPCLYYSGILHHDHYLRSEQAQLWRTYSLEVFEELYKPVSVFNI